MRRNRIILFILWIMSLVAISFYGGPVSYGFFIVFTLIPIVSFIYIIFVIAYFRIYQKLDGRNLTAGRTSRFYFTLQNESPVSFAAIRVIFYSSFSAINGLDDQTEYELMPHTGIRKETGLICRYRGEYEVGIKKIIVQDPLRLFSVSYKNREPLRVNVRPDIITLSQLNTDDRIISSSRDARVNMTESDVTAREYVPGDDRKRIHWKATAAMQKLMTRESIGLRQQGIGIIMNPKRISDKEEDYLPIENKMLETVIALVLFYVNQNTPASIWLGSDPTEEAVSDTRRFDGFYERISAFSFEREAESALYYEAVLQGGSISDKKEIYLVTHMLSDRETSFINELARIGVPVTVYAVVPEDSKYIQPDKIKGCTIVYVSSDADLSEVI